MKIHRLYWCRRCNVPLLTESCNLCRKDEVTEVKITPPGNVKPLFEPEGLRLRKLISETYGEEAASLIAPKDRIVVLNKVPHEDLAYETICDGHLIGLWRYEVRKAKWIFLPHMEGARRLASIKARKWITVDRGAEKAIVDGGKNLLAPGVIEFDKEIKEDDFVYIVNTEWKAIAVGKVVTSLDHRIKIRKGVVVKVKYSDKPKDPEITDTKATWTEAVKANEIFLKNRELKAIEFISRESTKYDKPILVSFSGGKDSLTVLILVKKALDKLNMKFHVLFSNTGVEYPETEAYVNRIVKQMNLEDRTIKINTFSNFFDALEVFGPPARDFRWCCKTCKLAPLAYIVRSMGGECVTFIGSRWVESIKRKKQGAMWESVWIKGQIGISPIYDWGTLDVWLYLLKEGVELNPLYHKGLERVGCWVCPSMDLAEMQIVRVLLGEKLADYLERIRKMLMLEEEGEKLGLWRWRFRWPKWIKDAKIKNLRREGPQDYYFKMGKLIVNAGSGDDVRRMMSILRTLYDLRVDEKRIELIIGKRKVAEIIVSEDGKIIVKGQETHLKRIFRSIARALVCVKCRLCIALCPNNAASLSEEGFIEISSDKCMMCGECNYLCPVWAYSLKSPHLAKRLLE